MVVINLTLPMTVCIKHRLRVRDVEIGSLQFVLLNKVCTFASGTEIDIQQCNWNSSLH